LAKAKPEAGARNYDRLGWIKQWPKAKRAGELDGPPIWPHPALRKKENARTTERVSLGVSPTHAEGEKIRRRSRGLKAQGRLEDEKQGGRLVKAWVPDTSPNADRKRTAHQYAPATYSSSPECRPGHKKGSRRSWERR